MSMEDVLQNGNEQIPNLVTCLVSGRKNMELAGGTIRPCSPPEIIQIESSDENIDWLPTCSDLEEDDIVSGTEVNRVDVSAEDVLQNGSEQIPNLDTVTCLESDSKNMVLEDRTIRQCSSPEIIKIESSDENLDWLPTCSDLEEDDLVSGTKVKGTYVSVEDVLQNGKEQIPSLDAVTCLTSDSKNMVLGGRTIGQCSSLEIIQIESSDENIDWLPTCSDFEEDDIVSGTKVKDEVLDARGGSSDASGSVCRTVVNSGFHSICLQSNKGQSLSNRLHCENNFPHGPDLCSLKSDNPLLQTIYSKYGDITKGCNTKSETFKKGCFLAICRVVQKLQDTSIDDITPDDVSELYSSIKDAESVNFDIKWLHQRLLEVEEVMRSRDELKQLEEAQKTSFLQGENLQKFIQKNNLEVAKLEHEIEMLKEEQAVQKSRLEEIEVLTEDIKTSCRNVPTYLMDWLL